MAIKDESDNVWSEPKKKKRGPKPAEIHDRPIAPATSPAPATPARTSYQPRTTPAPFQKIGFGGSIFDFNARAEAASLAFEAQFQFQPSPGLLLDIVRSPTTIDEFEDLFAIPSSFQRARAAQVLENAAQAERENIAEAEDIPDAQPAPREGYDLLAERAEADAQAEDESLGGIERLAWGVPTLAVKQVVESFVSAPAGGIAVGQGVYADVGDVLQGNFAFARSREIAKAMGESVVEDFRHPLDNPGFLLLDILGGATVVAGGAARVGAAGRASAVTKAVREGAEVPELSIADNLRPETLNRAALGQRGRAVISALARRPLPGTFALGPEGAQERVLMSENALRRGLQRAWYTRLQKSLLRHMEADPDPVIRKLGRLKSTRQSIFSPEKTLGRTATARLRVERDAMLAPVHALARAQRASFNLSRLYRSLPITRKTVKGTAARAEGASMFGLSIGEEMALYLKSLDDFDPVNTARTFHTNMIQWGLGDPKAHEAKLAAIHLGEKVLANPSKKFSRTLEALERVSVEQQLLKIDFLGLGPIRAEKRIANEAETMRLAAEAVDKQDYLDAVDELLGGEPLKKLISESFYYPSIRRKDAPMITGESSIAGARSGGQFGIAAPNTGRTVRELSHRFEGRAIRAGDSVLDASLLLGGAYTRVVKAVSVLEDYDRLIALSIESPNAAVKSQRGFLRAIRLPDAKEIPDELRELLAVFREDRVMTAEEARTLSDNKDLEALREYLYPNVDPENPIEGVRWVDERVMTDLYRYPGEPGAFKKAFILLNEPAKAGMIYAKPSYAINALSNAGMLLIQQGHLAPVSMWKSLRSGKDLSPEIRAAIDGLVGDGKAKSFTSDDIVTAKASRTMANVWSRLVDNWMRRAAFIYEANRQGFKTKEDFERLLDPKNRGAVDKRVEITRRSNKAMVEFDNMTWFEKQYLRDTVFVYPWVSRSAVWGLRTMLERPLKTWAVSELGQMGENYVNETFEEVTGWSSKWLPDWFKDAGYIPVGIDESGNPLVINPASVNTFSTLGDLLQTSEGVFTDDPLHSLEDVLGPTPELILRITTGRNSFGQKYEHGAWGGVAEMAGNFPVVSAFKKPKEVEPTLDEQGRPVNIVSTDPNAPGYVQGTAKGQVAPAIDRPTFIPGMESAFGPLISGGLFPRAVDMEALQARYWRDAPKEAKAERSGELRAGMLRQIAKDEIRMIQNAESITARILNEDVPTGVKRGIKLQEWFQYAFTDYSIKRGRKPTPAEQRAIQIDTLEEKGAIGIDRAEELRTELEKAVQAGDLGSFTRSFGDSHLFRQEWKNWHDDRNAVLEVANNLVPQIAYLRSLGLFDGRVPKASRLATPQMISPSAEDIKRKGAPDFDADSPIYQVGRQYLEYEKKLGARQPSETSMLEGVNAARFDVWIDEQDKPIKVKGMSYPSPVRLKYAADILRESIDDPEYEAKKLATYSAQSWETLSNFEKALVGKPVPEKVSTGWMIFEAVAGGYRANVTSADVEGISLVERGGENTNLSDYVPEPLPPGQRDLDAEWRMGLAKWVDRYFVKGFLADYRYANLPKYARVVELPAITKSKNVKTWAEVLTYADQAHAEIRALRAAGEDGIGVIQDGWKDYVTRTLFPWFQDNDVEFLQELNRFGGEDFLRTLIDD